MWLSPHTRELGPEAVAGPRQRKRGRGSQEQGLGPTGASAAPFRKALGGRATSPARPPRWWRGGTHLRAPGPAECRPSGGSASVRPIPAPIPAWLPRPHTWPSLSRAQPLAQQGAESREVVPGPGLEAARRPETPGPVPMAAGGSGGLRRPPDKARSPASCHCAAAPARPSAGTPGGRGELRTPAPPAGPGPASASPGSRRRPPAPTQAPRFPAQSGPLRPECWWQNRGDQDTDPSTWGSWTRLSAQP